VICRIKRSDIISNNIKDKDVIVGLSSFGQAIYEKEYNGGIGSNGLTSARHDIFCNSIAKKYPESYDHAIPPELVYSGNKNLTEKLNSNALNINIGKLVLSPTRTYAPVIKEILKYYHSQIHGIIHCSGGAQTKVLNFVNDLHIVKDNMFSIPPLFKLIKEQSNTGWQEMYKVFNMGHRMELYISKDIAQDIINISKKFNVDAQIIGYCEKATKKSLLIKNEFGEFNY
jgi:phosphoribosylformylglycinamidine cyclo-ligase